MILSLSSGNGNVCCTHCSTVGSVGRRAGAGPVVEYEVVLDAVSRVCNADEVEANRDVPAGGRDEGPLAVGVIWVRVRIPRAGEGAAVSIQSAPAACRGRMTGGLRPRSM